MTRFTILGSRGFIGQKLVQFLKPNHEVLTPEPSEWNSTTNWGHVIYCIGLTANYRKYPHRTIEAHVTLLSKFLNDCIFERFVFLSSTRVYQYMNHTSPINLIPVRVHHEEDLYNLSKLVGESLCINIPKCIAVRLSNVVGAGLSKHPFISQLISESFSGTITLKSHPDSEKDYISVQDVVELLTQIALTGTQKLYNLASGYQTKHIDLCKKIQQYQPCELDFNLQSKLYSFPQIDIQQIKAEFDFTPRSLESDIQALIMSLS